MMVGMKNLRRSVMSLQGPEGTRNELWRQRIQDVSLLELQSLQLSFDLLKGDAM